MSNYKYAFNGRFLTKKLTGQERFASELLANLDKICEKGEFCVVTSENPVWLPKYENIDIIQTGRLKREAWEQFCLGPWLWKNKVKCVNLTTTFSLFHCDIVCLHDASIFEIGKEFMHSMYGFFGTIWKRFLFRRAKRKADLILTVSNYSKHKFNELLGIPDEKIHIIYNAWQHFERVDADDGIFAKIPQTALAKGYFLAVSSLSPQKNFVWIREVAKRNSECQFVIVGKKEGFTKLDSNDLKADNLHFTGYLTDGEIKCLMQRCRAFIHPAIYEGFGIPPLEAMSCGAPVIVSTATCLPEIYGKSVHYIDPHNYDVDLEKLLSEPVAPREEVLDRFNWRIEAEKLYEILKR